MPVHECVCVCVFIFRHPLVHDSRVRQEHCLSRLEEREREREIRSRLWNAPAFLCLSFSLPLFPSFLLSGFSSVCHSLSTIPELDTFSENRLKTLSEFVPNVSQFLPVSKTVWAEFTEQLLSFSAQKPPSYSQSTKAVVRACDTVEPDSKCAEILCQCI